MSFTAMSMRKFMIIIVAKYFIDLCLSSETCSAVNGTLNEVEWPSTKSKILSKPPCVDERREFVYRQCSNGTWQSEPLCFYVQPETLPQCPHDFTFAGTFCYKLTHKAPYPPKCPYENIIPFDSYKHIITEPVWMPVTRDNFDTFGFLTWKEFSPLYKTYYGGTFTYNGSIKDKDCLVYVNATYIIAVSCKENYPRICAYKTLDQMSTQMCFSGTCRQSDFAPNSPCFCLEKKNSKVKAEFVNVYQNNIYNLLTNETCAIGLENSNGTYIWSNSKKEIDYTYWSPNVDFDKTYIYGAFTNTGWILTDEELSCSVSESSILDFEPSIDLTYDSINNHFTLSVSNPRGLLELDSSVWVYCFTDAAPFELVHRFDNISLITHLENFYLYRIEEIEDGPGSYWCESVRYNDLELIRTYVTTFDKDDFLYDFVIVLSMEYDETIDPLSEDIGTLVKNYLCPEFTKVEEEFFISCRLMKIVDIDEETRTVWVNVHISTYANYENYDQLLRTSVEECIENVKNVSTKLVSFLSSNYCFSEEVNNLTWPLTKIRELATSTTICFAPNGERVQRLCGGNFIDGAQWYNFSSCEMPQTSSTTPFLLQTLEKPSAENLGELCELSKNSSNFVAVDVYIISSILINAMDSNDYYEMVLEIYDNLFKIDKKILMESESKVQGTTSLRWVWYFIILQYTSKAEMRSIQKTNFALNACEKSNVCGLALQKDGNYTQSLIDCSSTLEDIARIENLESAFLVQADVLTDTDFFITFYNDAFFTQKTVSLKVVGSIVSMRLPDGFSEQASDMFNFNITIVYKIKTDEDQERLCSFWSDETSQWINTRRRINSSLMICEDTYGFEKFWALTSNIPDSSNNTSNDVTDDIITILDSNDTATDTVDKLLNISARYKEFESLDIYLFGQVFKKLSTEKDINLKSLTQIVSNIHETEQDILIKSQREKMATDLLLSNIDVIIQNHKYRNQVNEVAQNFMIFIFDVNNSNFSGLAILQTEQMYTTQILEDDFDSLKYPNLVSALLLPKQLKDQMKKDSKVVVTVFLKDVLFPNEQVASKVANNIFGVIIPQISAFSAPVTILHRVSNTSTKSKCVHWYYNQAPEVAGFWKDDYDGITNDDSLIQCHYWHTTHFGLLIMDYDRYENNDDFLDKLTTVNFVISLVCLNSVILTAVLFKKWRSDRSNQVLLNFVVVGILKIIFFYLSSTYKDAAVEVCITIGAVLHYCVLCQFFWMLIIAVLQFRRLVTVFATHEAILPKICLCGYLPPLVPVLSVLVFDIRSYVRSKVGLCYPSGLSLYLSIWLPVITVLAVNLIIFASIMYSVIWRKTDPAVTSKKKDRRSYMRLSIFLFSMLGFTWVFGFLAELSFGEIFVYLFVLTASLQGYVIFLYFIVFSANTKALYLKAVRSRFNKTKSFLN